MHVEFKQNQEDFYIVKNTGWVEGRLIKFRFEILRMDLVYPVKYLTNFVAERLLRRMEKEPVAYYYNR